MFNYLQGACHGAEVYLFTCGSYHNIRIPLQAIRLAFISSYLLLDQPLLW